MKALVEFCASNVASYTQAVMDALEQDPELDVDVLEYGCLGYCGECYLEPFALVNGKLVQAPTAEALLDKIKQVLKEEDDPFKDLPL
ncbi:UDP-N-acetylmuramoylalanine--D-glutamate ligase [Brevibacillus panacihumi W25]|uniref:UDP-N-acetylmuramoylalanine--D-glutamate ligase n=2 Tax=Brevibacillus panacihumi TaxID=497735 RepID=V6M4L5_9BACL|nr:YuzB family protein [Brevibacillus panacihumi]EST53524.1 UDP-N-acetylmuramoylalanine--D-glutamate ligase [Brevibacillus panacihumi W25]RNB78013.1 DUF1450 domain-containing protein [Brevibacillus panacihumi]HZG79860.1 YuzB family protein [Brevibacillus sp.]